MWRTVSCKLDKVKGSGGKQAAYWEVPTGTNGRRNGSGSEQGIVRAGIVLGQRS